MLSPPRKRGSRSVHIELDSRFRGNDRPRVILRRARGLPAMAYTRQVTGKRSPPELWLATTGAASLVTDISAPEAAEGTSLCFRISIFEFLISCF